MNVQNFILSKLRGDDALPSADALKGVSESLSEITNVNPGFLPIPVRKCEFVLQTSFDNFDKIVFLTSLDMPKSGLEFSLNELFFPIGKVAATECTISGYIYRSWKGNIMNLYMRQFKNGLYNISVPKLDVRISWLNFNDSDHTKPSISKSNAVEPPFVSSINSAEKMYLALDQDQLYPWVQMSKCVFSQPTFQVDPTSNDFVKVSMKISFNRLVYNQDYKG